MRVMYSKWGNNAKTDCKEKTKGIVEQKIIIYENLILKSRKCKTNFLFIHTTILIYR